MGEEEILRTVRGLETRRKSGRAMMVLGVLSVMAGLTQLIPGDPGDNNPMRLIGFCAAGGVLVVLGGMLIVFSPIPAAAKTGRLAMLRAEQLQVRRQAAFLLMPVSLTMMLIGVTRATGHLADGVPLRHVEMVSIFCFCLFVIVFALLLAGRGLDRWARPVLDDETSRQFRGQALQLGYMILLPGVVALFAVSLVWRNVAMELVPFLAVLGVGGPALRLFWLERSARGTDEA